MASAQAFDDMLAETQSGADEVRDSALRVSYAFPSADVLVPAPMAVSVLGQLTLLATATDFKLVKPATGFKHVRYPDSFRATIMQLVNSGCLALNQSFVNFDEINKRCAAVRPGVNNIVQLLVGHEENTPRQNELAIERHLPNQIASLSKTVQACLEKAKETDQVFSQLLELTMEIHESCTATQGDNEDRVLEANVRKKWLEQEKSAVEDMKQISAEALKGARDDFANVQHQFNKAANSMPSPGKIALLGFADVAQCFLSLFSRSSAPSSSPIGTTAHSEPSVNASDARDPGYQKGSRLRLYAERLDTLLTAGKNGSPDWSAIKSSGEDGSIAVRVGLEQIHQSIERDHKHAKTATSRALNLSKKGEEFARRLQSMVPPGIRSDIAQLSAQVSAWREDVLAFAVEADMKLGNSQMRSNAFIPHPDYASMTGSSAQLAVRSAQYNLNVMQAQLNASRENCRAASDKLMEVSGQLGNILAQIAGLDVRKQNWEAIMEILLKAIDFLCELKKYLNNLVHFFDAVNNLVSITLRETADQFIQIVKDATAIESEPGKESRRVGGGVSLDAWARQAIYNHALSTAKISRVVENISGMYVTLYDGNVHPGVNMLLGMGKLVGSNNPQEVADAGQKIQDWAKEASEKIVKLVSERMHENERDIENRIRQVEKSLGNILPRSSRMEEIVHRVEASQVREVAEEMDNATKKNPVYGR
ncbi:hypothetical protein L226DRAFT_490578, partial [Lentinus tigrinus ALCF2SS1-7]